jgi:hypothetical protein
MAAATSAGCASFPITNVGITAVLSEAPARLPMSATLVTPAARAGPAMLSPAINAVPATAANFLNCICFSSVFCFLFCAVYAHFGANLRLQYQVDEGREKVSAQSPDTRTLSRSDQQPDLLAPKRLYAIARHGVR